jgi:hypothetical protein
MNLHLQGSVYGIYSCGVHFGVVQTRRVSVARGFARRVCRRSRTKRKRAHFTISWPFRFHSRLRSRRRGGITRGYRAGHPPYRDIQCWARRRPCSGRAPPPRRRGRFGTRASPRWLSDPLPPLGGSRDPSRGSRHPRLFVPLGDFSRDAQARDASRQLASRRDHPAHRPAPSDDARLFLPRARAAR